MIFEAGTSESTPTRADLLDEIRGYARHWSRKPVNIPTELEVRVRSTGDVHSTGKAIIRNISLKGALLAKMVMRDQTLPVRPFDIHLRFNGPTYKGIGAVCRPVRFGQGPEFELAVRFEDFWVGERSDGG